MKKQLFLSIPMLMLLLLTACNPDQATDNTAVSEKPESLITEKDNPTPITEKPTKTSNEKSSSIPFQKESLKKTKEDGRYAYYNGTITLSGEYFMRAPGEMGGGTLCFHANKATGYLVPREGVDARSPWFCFFDQDETKKTFEMDDTKIFKDGTESTVRCVEGKATIQISDYMVDKMESEVTDMAKLEKIITKEPYAMECPGWE